MKVLLILLFALLLPQIDAKISASLMIITYEPLQFNLSFSQPVPLPRFQLLFNEYPIPYKATPVYAENSLSGESSTFLVEAST